MKDDHTERIAALQSLQQPVAPDDSMAEAGRKVLLGELIVMLQREAGSRTGEDIEDVHIMRVSTRRMRSAFRVLRPYFKVKAVQPFMRDLRQTAAALGAVRDLDVLILDLQRFQATLDADGQSAMGEIIAQLDERRDAARSNLNALLNSKAYRRFLKRFSGFVTQPGEGAVALRQNTPRPYQVRHVLPLLIAERLASVRAYDPLLAGEPDVETLHALRIEFKRLRYTVSLFNSVLGKSIAEFITELKVIQDHLGRLNDIATARHRLDMLLDELDGVNMGMLNAYLDSLEAEAPALVAGFPEVWTRFNSRKVQERLSSALLALH
ncbi:MAG: CHAD domain-containing protein [Anaerolineaceae bacterium]|nr:CHAD domain-containing protein [Anaerolineaceae bacterium]